MSQIINLTEPTVFPELNKKESKEINFARETIQLTPLKYKHIREALKYPVPDQMHQLMIMLTGLNESDIGELSPEDAAKLTISLHDSLQRFNQAN